MTDTHIIYTNDTNALMHHVERCVAPMFTLAIVCSLCVWSTRVLGCRKEGGVFGRTRPFEVDDSTRLAGPSSMPPANGKPPAGQGFAAATALSRGMGDLSMGDPKMGLDETLYEFKENNEKQDSIDEIDDFERRMAGSDSPRVAKPAAPTKSKAPAAAGPKAAKKTGADYVRSAQKQKKTTEEEEEDAEDVRQAMADLDKFGQHGDSDQE